MTAQIYMYLGRNNLEGKYFHISNCILTIKGCTDKQIILRCFFTTDLLCLHEKFQVYQSSPSGFFYKKCHIFNHICGENIFLPKYLRFYTSQKKNYQIGIKIEQKLGLYFSKLLKSLMLWIAT